MNPNGKSRPRALEISWGGLSPDTEVQRTMTYSTASLSYMYLSLNKQLFKTYPLPSFVLMVGTQQ